MKHFSKKSLRVGLTIAFILVILTFPLVLYLANTEQDQRSAAQVAATFTNPIINGADPWVIYKDGFYYYTRTGGSVIDIFKSPTLSGIPKGIKRTVYAPVSGPASQQVWAPELHFLNGKWYVYFSASDGVIQNQRTYVLEAKTDDPQGDYLFKGKIADPNADYQAIDGSVFEYNGQMYFIWAGTHPSEIGGIYIARMSNPWTLSSQRVKIAIPEYAWEKQGWEQVEAPQALQKDGRLFIVYSGSSTSSPDYALGLLTYNGGSILSKSGWNKRNTPVFKKTDKVFGPGHASFTQSIDGTEDWFMYHARNTTDPNEQRTTRMQKFTWNADGTPNFGTPIAAGTQIPLPSGEKGVVTTKPTSTPKPNSNQSGRYTLSGKVFVDKNGNGAFNGNEQTFENVKVEVYKKGTTGAFTIRCCSKSTNSQGDFSIPDRTAGEYQLTVTPPRNYTVVNNSQRVTLGPNAKVSFILVRGDAPTSTKAPTPTKSKATATPTKTTAPKYSRVTLQGTVFIDSDKDGVLDSNEKGQSGVKVTVAKKSSSGNFDIHCCSTTTNSSGKYSIPNRTLGQYRLTITLPSGYNSRAVSKTTNLNGNSNASTVNFDLYR